MTTDLDGAFEGVMERLKKQTATIRSLSQCVVQGCDSEHTRSTSKWVTFDTKRGTETIRCRAWVSLQFCPEHDTHLVR